MNGKGSKRRPQYVTNAEFAANWRKAFMQPPRDKLLKRKIRTK